MLARAKDPPIGNPMINARVETIIEKPAFRRAASRRRLLVPADGDEEWEQREGQKAKVTHFLHAPDRSLLGFADSTSCGPTPAAPTTTPTGGGGR